MRIELVRNTLVEGVHHDAGEVLEVEDQLAEALIFMKRARVAAEMAVVEPAEAAVELVEEKAILEPLEVAGRKRRKGR
jgi:hypothetical protein